MATEKLDPETLEEVIKEAGLSRRDAKKMRDANAGKQVRRGMGHGPATPPQPPTDRL